MMMFFFEFGLVVFGAIVLDLAFGDPRNRFHPTAWMGRLLSILVSCFACRGFRVERLGGIITVVIVVMVVVSAVSLFFFVISMGDTSYLHNSHNMIFDAIAYTFVSVLISCILLKCTIAIRGMQKYANAVIESLHDNDMTRARNNLSMIVKRDTSKLDQRHIISGVLESIAENTVDGVTGSLFYYGLFGLPGAFAHRVINTADSMIGYQSDMFKNLGWFAAHADTILNYLPARLTALSMIGAAFLLKYDWRQSYRVMIRDGNATASRNSGYPMATLAGALNIKLEKSGQYTLCANGDAPMLDDVSRAVMLMKTSILLFTIGVVLPLGFLYGVIFGRYFL